jgi:hypothetical protein
LIQIMGPVLMYPCPHCRQHGIPTLHKLLSVSFAPATCTLCGRRSYLHVVHGLRAMVAWVLLTWVFIGVALWQGMSIYLIGTVPAFFFAVDKWMLSAPMLPRG